MFLINTLDKELKSQAEQQKYFDFYRLVEVGTHCVYDYHDGTLQLQSEPCYAVWKRDSACNNCSSFTACHTNRQIIKLECLQDAVFIVFSQPVTIAGKTMALELIRDVTETMLFNDGQHASNIGIQDLIKTINELIVHDALTGTFNRRYVDLALTNLMRDFTEKALPFSMIMVDVDHLKQINDTLGHPAGDEALLTIGRILNKYLPNPQSWVGRIGGDEFIVAIQGTTAAQVEQYNQTITDAIHAYKLYDTLTLSISTGIAEYIAGSSISDLMAIADKNMYMDKRRKQL